MRFAYAATTVVLYLSLTGWSVATFWSEMVGKPLRALAERIEARASPVNLDPGQLKRLFDPRRAMLVCARELVRSGASIELAALDAAALQGRLTDDDLRASDDILRQALRCFPADGNLWLRLAMVEVVRSGTFDRAFAMVERSALLAPGEGWILQARMAWLSQLDDKGLGLMVDVLRADVLKYAQFAPPADIARSYVDGNELLRQAFDVSVAGLNAGRRKLVEQEISNERTRRSLKATRSAP